MTQCERCRYSFGLHGQLRCRKQTMQRCRYEKGVQRLETVPGYCAHLNPNDDCPVFKPSIMVWVLGLLQKFRNVTKD